MAEKEYEDYTFPDETKAEKPEAEEEFEIEIEDDTPPRRSGPSADA